MLHDYFQNFSDMSDSQQPLIRFCVRLPNGFEMVKLQKIADTVADDGNFFDCAGQRTRSENRLSNVVSRSDVVPGCGREVAIEALRTAVSHLNRSWASRVEIEQAPLPCDIRVKDWSWLVSAAMSASGNNADMRFSSHDSCTRIQRCRLHIIISPTLMNSSRSTRGT